MPTTTGLSADQLRAKIDELKSQGKTESNSKSLGKYVNALKVLEPQKYGDKDVSGAKLALRSSTQPASAPSGVTSTNAVSTPTTSTLAGVDSEIAVLQKQLADRKDAINKATGNINDNPWYSEATRVGKIAKLNEQSAMDIKNIQDQLDQKEQGRLNQISQNQWQQEFNLKKETAGKPTIQTVTNKNGDLVGYDANTGSVVYTIPGVSKPASTFDLANFWNSLGTNNGDISSLWDNL